MTIKPLWIDRGVSIALGLVVAITGALFLHLRTVASAPQDSTLLYRFADHQDPVRPPEGFTSQGMKVGSEHKDQAGWAVRYAAKGCEYCRADELLWRRMSTDLRQMGYQVIVVVPEAKDEYPNNTQTPIGSEQEAYVDVGWIRQFRLSMTPTLLIFDSKHGLIWSRQGMLGRADPESAARTIRMWKSK